MGDNEVFDSTKLKNTIRFMIDSDMRNVVIDLGNLDYLYSDTINAFIASNRHMLEVSGRITILTEHPKVQDILKRAGIDNIMRIYRSEAEMIADSKEIIRQTSGHRVDDIQNQAHAQPVEPAKPKTEFDDFRSVIGEQLGTKLDNNEVPQHQFGGASPAAAPRFAPPGAPPFAGYPQTPQAQGFPPSAPQQPPPGFAGGYAPPSPPPQFGGGYAMPSAPEPPAQNFPPAGNFDFPTVQMPAGGFTGYNPPGAPPAPPHFPPEMPPVSPDPSRKQQDKRGDGRSEAKTAKADQGSSAYQPPPTLTPANIPASKAPIDTVPYLVTEKKSSFMMPMVAGIVVLALAGGVAYFVTAKKKPAEASSAAPKTAPEISAPITTPTPVAPAEPKAATKTEPVAESKVEAKSEPKTETKTEVKPDPIAETKTDPKNQPKTETKAVVQVKVPPGSLAITSNPPGADVLVNFSKKGVTPITLKLASSSNRIIVKLNGYKKFETSVNKNTKERNLNVELEAESGSTPPVETKIEPKVEEKIEAKVEPKVEPKVETKPKVEPKIEPKVETKPKIEPKVEPKVETKTTPEPAGNGTSGTIFLSSSPARADIFVDGKPTDKVTPTKLELPVGSHTIEMSKDGLKASVDQKIISGKNKALHLQLH